MSNYNTAETLNYAIQLQRYLFGDDIPIRYRNSIMSFDTFLYTKFLPFCGRLEEEVNEEYPELKIIEISPKFYTQTNYGAINGLSLLVECTKDIVYESDVDKLVDFLDKYFNSGYLQYREVNDDDLLELSYIDPTIQDFIYKSRETIKNKVENMTPLVNNPDFWKHIKEYYLKRFFQE